jgi:hypothetical protein
MSRCDVSKASEQVRRARWPRARCCPACGYGTAPWDLATGGGAMLSPQGNVGGLTQPTAASFLSPAQGWVTGLEISYRNPGRPRRCVRIVATADGGRTWRVEYTSASP